MRVAAASHSYTITTPPSVNHLFVNARGKGRRKSNQYAAWIRGTLKELVFQRAKPAPVPCGVVITFPESMRGDCDGRIKAALDLFVRGGILVDDSRKYVRSVTAGFGPIDQTAVRFEACEVSPA